MELEETLVYPLIQREVDKDLAEEAEVEHQLARDGLDQLEELSPDEPGFDGALAMVVAGIEHHVLEEETEAFPGLATSLGAERLAELARQLTSARAELLDTETPARRPAKKADARARPPQAGDPGRSLAPQSPCPTEDRSRPDDQGRPGGAGQEGRRRRLLPHDESRARPSAHPGVRRRAAALAVAPRCGTSRSPRRGTTSFATGTSSLTSATTMQEATTVTKDSDPAGWGVAESGQSGAGATSSLRIRPSASRAASTITVRAIP